jgi:two-component system chemotaxis response regulator CheY
MIILAEDDADERTALMLALERAGYPVRGARDGREALELQRRQRARFLITDLFMPEMDGLELLERFKREYPQTKIVVISGGRGRSPEGYLESARLAGADAVLTKPFEVDQLLATLRDIGTPAA